MFIIAVGWPDLGSGTRPGSAPKLPGLKLLASKSDVRAWPGGFGYAKVGAVSFWDKDLPIPNYFIWIPLSRKKNGLSLVAHFGDISVTER